MKGKSKRPTQKEMILDYMRIYGWITPMDAIEHIGCTKLSTRIGELARKGYEIVKEWVVKKNRWGVTVRYKRYRLAV